MKRSNIAAPMGQLYIYILCYISSILHIATASSSSNPSFTVLLQDSNVHQNNNKRRLKGEIMVKISNDLAALILIF